MIVTRIGDSAFGTCFWPPPTAGPGPLPATGIVVTGDPMELNSGMPTSRIGDTLVFPCGTAMIMSGAVMDLATGMPTSNLGAMVVGPMVQAVITSGDPLNISPV
jgi:uncharacterized Zn-binding protein involved in type VI secretion